jgi:hypothetical protein
MNRPAQAKPDQLPILSLSLHLLTSGPQPRQRLQAQQRTGNARARARPFSVSWVSLFFDFRRFKAPFDEPFCPTNSPVNSLHFPSNLTEREPPGCSQTISQSRGNCCRSSTTTVDTGVPLTFLCLHSIPWFLGTYLTRFCAFSCSGSTGSSATDATVCRSICDERFRLTPSAPSSSTSPSTSSRLCALIGITQAS